MILKHFTVLWESKSFEIQCKQFIKGGHKRDLRDSNSKVHACKKKFYKLKHANFKSII